jgi:hypothetical protein
MLKYVGLGGAGFFLGFVAYFAWSIYNFGPSCGHQALGSYLSPDGTKKVVLFVVDCGATTSFSVHASILPSAEELHDTDKGNVFIADANHGAAAEYNAIGGPAVQVAWSDRNEVEIRYSRGARIFLEIPRFGQTRVSYSPF